MVQKAEKAEEATRTNICFSRKDHINDKPLKNKESNLLTTMEEQLKRLHELYPKLLKTENSEEE